MQARGSALSHSSIIEFMYMTHAFQWHTPF